jgi:hypothetical protein
MNRTFFCVLLLAMATLISSCQAVSAIFKAGVWVGVLGVVLVVGLIIYFITRSKN